MGGIVGVVAFLKDMEKYLMKAVDTPGVPPQQRALDRARLDIIGSAIEMLAPAIIDEPDLKKRVAIKRNFEDANEKGTPYLMLDQNNFWRLRHVGDKEKKK